MRFMVWRAKYFSKHTLQMSEYGYGSAVVGFLHTGNFLPWYFLELLHAVIVLASSLVRL